jgi:hypothetical protein
MENAKMVKISSDFLLVCGGSEKIWCALVTPKIGWNR